MGIEVRHAKVHASKVHYLNLLSGPLNIELQTEIWEPVLTAHPLYKRYTMTHRSMFGQVCSVAISTVDVGKYDLIFKAGAEAGHMYFVNTGTVAYLRTLAATEKNPEKRSTKLEPGEWRTEPTLWV